jgi:hypothetical protein
MTNLVACPHCGATKDAGVVHVEKAADAFGAFVEGQRYVLCDFRIGGCGASGGVRDTEDDAIAVWNRRAAEPTGNVVQLHATDLSHVSEAIERLLSAMRRGGMGTLASYMDGFHITVEPAKPDAPLHCDPIGDGPLCQKYPDCQCGRSLNRPAEPT